METSSIDKRSIDHKWQVQNHKNSPGHQAWMVLPPGNWAAFDPFLLMAEDNMKKGAFDYHPHRGIETVTYMIDGVLEHRDNKGGKGIIKKGEAQWMTAGKGLLHLEEAQGNGFSHSLQLWLNLPAKDKMIQPRYQDITESTTPVRIENGVVAKVFSGNSGTVHSGTQNQVPVTMVEATLQPGATFTQDFPKDYNGFIFVLEGTGVFGENQMPGAAKEVLWMTLSVEQESEITIRAKDESLKVLILAGKPLREPVFAGGPFVMSSGADLKQAYQDFRKGLFGKWISETELTPEV